MKVIGRQEKSRFVALVEHFHWTKKNAGINYNTTAHVSVMFKISTAVVGASPTLRTSSFLERWKEPFLLLKGILGTSSHETWHLSGDERHRSLALCTVGPHCGTLGMWSERRPTVCKRNGAFLSSHKNGKSGKGSGKLFTQFSHASGNENVVHRRFVISQHALVIITASSGFNDMLDMLPKEYKLAFNFIGDYLLKKKEH